MALSEAKDIYNLALGYVGIENEVASTTESSAEAKLADRFYDPCLQQLLSGYDWPWAHKVAELAGGFKISSLIARTGSDGAITSDTTFTSASASFTTADVGRFITAEGAAGSASFDLFTTIVAYTSPTVVTLADTGDNESSIDWTLHSTADMAVYPWTYKFNFPSDCLTPRFILPTGSTPLTGEERIPFEVSNYLDVKVLFTDENQAATDATPAINLAYTMYETTTTVWPIQFDHALALLMAANLAIPLAGEGSLRETLMDQHRIMLAECISQSMDMRRRGPEKGTDIELVETRFS